MTSWNPEKKHSDRERWICIYPAYLNSKKTISLGRRVTKEQGIDNPTCQEIRDVLSSAGLTIGVENKMYPRDPNRDVIFRGRVRVQLKNDDGTPVDPNFPTRDAVFLYCCDMIPKLKSRQQKQSTPDLPQQTSTKKTKGKKGKR